MKYYTPTIPEVIHEQWPTKEFTYERGILTYPSGHVSLDTESINSATFTITKTMCEAAVRAAALDAVSLISETAIGTSDMRQLYIYDIKHKEAANLLESGMLTELGNSVVTNERMIEIISQCKLLSREADDLGVPLHDLAYAVLNQYQLSNDNLHEHLGRIEGIRRTTLQLVANARTFEDLDDIPEPQWFSVDDIIPF